MRLIVLCLRHGKTQKDRLGFGEAGPTVGVSNGGHSGIAHGASGSVARLGTNDLEGRRQGDRRWAGNRGAAPDEVSASQGERSTDAPAVGRAAAGADETGRGAGLSVRLETPGRARPIGGRDAATGGAGRKARAPSQALGGVSAAGSPPLAQSGPRHTTSQGPAKPPRRMEKKTLPQELEAMLTAQAVRERPIRLMFQDEARFGRMVRIRRCWAPAPLRPVVDNGYERQFTYVYGAISPREGQMDWKICDKMNTERMNEFLAQVSTAHRRDLIIMILDGASSHRSKDLAIPTN